MTIGIYMLYWDDEDMVYIGQSTNIENRIKAHIRQLKIGKHYNYKLTNMFNTKGIPNYTILEEVQNIETLDKLEISWMSEFDSISEGLNITEGGIGGGRGVNCSASKYSKITILRCFILLLRGMRTTDIGKKLGIPSSTIYNMKLGNSHLWFRSEYPDKFQSIQDSRVYSYDIVDPLGSIHTVTNITEFCIQRQDLGISLATGISTIIKGKRKQFKGYRLYGGTNAIPIETKPVYHIKDTTGKVYEITNVAGFCRTVPELCLPSVESASHSLSLVCRGKLSNYKGYSLA